MSERQNSVIVAIANYPKQLFDYVYYSGPATMAREIANTKGGQELTQWMAHGASEAANLVLHGHSAPLYTSQGTLPDLQGGVHGPEAPVGQAQPEAPSAANVPMQQVATAMDGTAPARPVSAESPPTTTPQPQQPEATPGQKALQNAASVWTAEQMNAELPNLRLDVENVLHSDPITPQPTPTIKKENEISR